MPTFSKLASAAVLAGSVAAQGPSVYIAPGTASFVPGTFGTTGSDGSYISAGVASNNGNFDDISFAAQNGGYAANVGLNQYGGGFQGGAGGFGGGYPGGGLGLNVGVGLGGGFPGGAGYGAGFQGGYSGGSGFGGGYSGGSGFGGAYAGGAPQGTGLGPPPPPIYQAGTGVSGGNINTPSGQGLGPPPPPIYQAGIGVSGGNLPGGPTVQVGVPIHTGGFKKTHKRDVKTANNAKQYPYGLGYSAYGGYGGYNGYRGYGNYGGYGGYGLASYGPTVTIGQPVASFVPGTFGQTFSDGGYTSWGTPSVSFKKRSLNKRQVISATAGYYGPTVSIGAPTALFVPGTFGTTFSDGGYTSWGVAQPQIPAYAQSYGAGSYYKREVSTESAQSIDKATVDGSRSDNRPLRNGYRKSGYDSDWSQSARKPSPNSIIQHNNGYESRNPFY